MLKMDHADNAMNSRSMTKAVLPEANEFRHPYEVIVLVAFPKSDEDAVDEPTQRRPETSSSSCTSRVSATTSEQQQQQQQKHHERPGSSASSTFTSRTTDKRSEKGKTGTLREYHQSVLENALKQVVRAPVPQQQEENTGKGKNASKPKKGDASADQVTSSVRDLKTAPSIERMVDLVWASSESKLKLLSWVDPEDTGDKSSEQQATGKDKKKATKGQTASKKSSTETQQEGKTDSWRIALSDWTLYAVTLYPAEKDKKIIEEDAFPLFKRLVDKLNGHCAELMKAYCLETREYLNDLLQQLYVIEAGTYNYLFFLFLRTSNNKCRQISISYSCLMQKQCYDSNHMFPRNLRKNERSSTRIHL